MRVDNINPSNGTGVPQDRKSSEQEEVAKLIKLMSGSIDDKRNAALVVGCYKPEFAALALPKLIELLDDNNEFVVVGALTSIGNIGSEVEIQKDDLLKVVHLLNDKKHKHPYSIYGSGVQYNTAYAIEKIGPNAKTVVKEFVEEIEKLVSDKDFDPSLVEFAVLALAMIGKDAEVARPLLDKFKSGQIKSDWDLSEVLDNVNLALAMIEPKEDNAITFFMDWVQSNKYIDGYKEIDKLEKVGGRSKCGINLLNRILNEKDISDTARNAINKALQGVSKTNI